MQAILCRAWGGPDELRFDEVARSPLRSHEARLRVHACGLNFADSLMIAGKYQIKPSLPFTPGLEAAGEVIEIGSAVSHLRVGQRVFAYFRSGGAFTEEGVVGAAAVVPISAAM